AQYLYRGIARAAEEYGVFAAAQCCEHLNRAVVVEREAVKAALDCGVISEVNVVPQPKAGGSFASEAYRSFRDPVVLEHIKADCGIDIGLTLIGMHLKEVAVPVRLSVSKIGEAYITAARTRAKFIGGSRAVYNEEML
ncbi:MAG: TIGR01440 family protein, partial [Clostridia bacterium]|nr:TIGR01440 family protein [Clostridia bacterium]